MNTFLAITVAGVEHRIPRSWLAGYCKGSASGGVRKLSEAEGVREWVRLLGRPLKRPAEKP